MTDRPVAIAGAGYTTLTRRPQHRPVDLAVEACLQATADAGIDPAFVDGLFLQTHHGDAPDTAAVARRIGINHVNWSCDGGFGVGALARAAQAIDAGECSSVLVCKIMDTVAPVNTPQIDSLTGDVGGDDQFEVPYGLGYTMQRVGFLMRRWMVRYKIRQDQIGWLAVAERRNALLNPRAVFSTPLSVDDYLGSRWIAEPVRLLDCDYPVNGAFAYLLARGDLARSLDPDPVWLLGWAGPAVGDVAPHLRPEEPPESNRIARELYRDTGLSPAHLDVWMLYDGFSFLAMQWMEALGVVEPGGSGEYVEGAERIVHTGEHPLNTHGGQLSEGRLHGAGHILEAFQQVRGTAGARQAARADIAVITSAFPYNGGAAVVGRR